jgi:hypothetical protein
VEMCDESKTEETLVATAKHHERPLKRKDCIRARSLISLGLAFGLQTRMGVGDKVASTVSDAVRVPHVHHPRVASHA